MKNLNTYIVEKYNTDSIEEYLESIVNSAKDKNPKIWDDTESWEAKDDFDYYQDASGSYDDVLEFIEQYANNKAVAGWMTKESFEETEKIIPKFLKDIIKKSKPEIPYKKKSNKFEVWETTDKGFDVTVMKFMNYTNDNGTDYVEYWYMIAIEK